ncbi:phosphoribosyltransferase family protein [Idiomarina abyssalis]|uniref:phosphoribosyltransferase family protein n=1 Tax=Idiomarina abyssalis TaxID=86102 RepID=UPI001C977D82|nr:phosphoribosyltransferase family protein [Idiomarina abyssalis]QZN90547.1 hypothetical protein K5X84_10340 [Idiomarina abyssalis]
MGFKVDGYGIVYLDENTDMFGDTRLSHNPTCTKTLCKEDPIFIYSLFLRKRNRTKKRDVGDNCPLIYALKSKENLKVTYNSIKPVILLLNDIIDKFLEQQLAMGCNFEAIVPVPSNHKIVRILSRRLGKKLNIPVEENLFRKARNDDIKGQLLLDKFGNNAVPQGARVNIMNAVGNADKNGKDFSISDVKTKNRKYVKPVIFNEETDSNKYRSIVLVDDVCSTGSTLVHAKDALHLNSFCSQIVAVCLFSPLSGRLKERI